jgi:exodeoxyribonuclease VII large subunit
MTPNRKVYSLTQLNQSLEKLFWSKFSERSFWVTAEVIKVNVKRGHYYLELADSRNETVTAKSFATIWSRNFRIIQEQIGSSELTGILKPGNNVLFALKIEYHAVYGLKLNVLNIDPSYSYGAIEKKRKEVIEKLRKEDLLDRQKQMKLPLIIKRIALVGSPDTSGFTDFYDELFNKHEFTKFVLKTFPVRVQGEQAISEIAAAIKEASLTDADVIVLLRGGGSKMDLAIFDDFSISKAIARSRIPVITGIGHETDRVVADLTANTYFKTPTAVASHIHYAIASFQEIMRDLKDKVVQRAQQVISEEREDFNHVSNYLQHFSRAMIQHWRIVFQQYENNVGSAAYTLIHEAERKQDKTIHELIYQVERTVQQEKNSVNQQLEEVSKNASRSIEEERKFSLSQLTGDILSYGQNQIERERLKLENTNDLLGILNPMKILQSGYTISTIDEVDLQDAEGELQGKVMKTLTSKHIITSEIKTLKKLIQSNENR